MISSERKPAEFETEVLTSFEITTDRDKGSVEVLKQRRIREDGRHGGEFISIKIDTGRRTLFVSPDLAQAIIDGFNHVLPVAVEQHTRIQKEYEERKAAREKRHTEQAKDQEGKGFDLYGGGHQQRTRKTGKTERKRNKMRGDKSAQGQS